MEMGMHVFMMNLEQKYFTKGSYESMDVLFFI
jgi:hypothetical protein